jgi:hypothetical protein
MTQDWGVQPWQSLKALDTWRNRLAHGKDDASGLREELLDVCTPDRLAIWRGAVREVCRGLHEAVMERYGLTGIEALGPFGGGPTT